MDRNAYLAKARKERENALKGKWIIVCDSPQYIGNLMYMQDQEICNKGFWTGFLCNAKGFENPYTAKAVCNRLKYNNPRVVQV